MTHADRKAALVALHRIGAGSAAAVAVQCGWGTDHARAVLRDLEELRLVECERRVEGPVWRLDRQAWRVS